MDPSWPLPGNHAGQTARPPWIASLIFRYDNLPNPTTDLRLIEIHPGTASDFMRCSIHTYSADECPRYEALSYAWGDDTDKVPMVLNSGNGDRLIEVTVNLDSALRNLRKRRTGQKPDRRLMIWIDALCIDQGSLDERNDQVQRMKAIYQGANKVIVYLGHYHEPSDRRIQFSSDIWGIDSLEDGSYSLTLAAVTIALHLSCANTVANSEEVSQMLAESSRRDRPGNPLANVYAWAHLSRLFNRSWFERLWIIQELAVSQEAIVLCGGIEISWTTLQDAAAFILRPDPATPAQIRRFFPLMGAHRATHVTLNTSADVDPRNILTILRHTQGASCSDPRDKLYSILGVVEDTADIDIDYSKPFDAVYRDWAMKRIIRTKSLDILSACTDSGRSGELPSWVPDLRRPWAHDKELWRHTHQYSEGQPHLENWSHLNSMLPRGQSWDKSHLFPGPGFQLCISGFLVCKVLSLSDVCDAVVGLFDPTNLTSRLFAIIKNLENWYQEYRQSKGLSRSVNLGSKIIRNTLLRQSQPDGSASNFHPYDFWHSNAIYREERRFHKIVSETLEHEIDFRKFEAALFSLVHGCQLFVTDDIYVGVVAGNCHAEVGDEVWLLSGGSTPFIVRRTSAGHRLISPCFLNRYMGSLAHPSLLYQPLSPITII